MALVLPVVVILRVMKSVMWLSDECIATRVVSQHHTHVICPWVVMDSNALSLEHQQRLCDH